VIMATWHIRTLGVCEKIVESMGSHNGTEPDLIERENRFIVRLWKKLDH